MIEFLLNCIIIMGETLALLFLVVLFLIVVVGAYKTVTEDNSKYDNVEEDEK